MPRPKIEIKIDGIEEETTEEISSVQPSSFTSSDVIVAPKEITKTTPKCPKCGGYNVTIIDVLKRTTNGSYTRVELEDAYGKCFDCKIEFNTRL